MSCKISAENIEKTIEFHGHVCPGVSIGIRAAEVCLDHFGHNDDVPLCTICETDMCAVDAVQVLTGCTFGKGNLIHRDLGKNAFSFFRKSDGAGVRVRVRPDAMGPSHKESSELIAESLKRELTADEHKRMAALRVEVQEYLMEQDLDKLFFIEEPRTEMPRGAAILETLTCADCGEGVMESRTRRFEGRTLCIPCFEKVEQKI